MKILLVVGARPNFMKIAPIIRAIESKNDSNLKYKLVHTGAVGWQSCGEDCGSSC